MIPVKQKIIKNGSVRGDCFRACMASLLELPNDDRLPHIESKNWLGEWMNLLETFGMRFGRSHSAFWKDGYWIASVPSLNFEKTTHAIIMKDFYVEFDPSLAKTYEKGRDLSQEKIVYQGEWLEVSDVSKLKNLDIYRNKLLTGGFDNVQMQTLHDTGISQPESI